MFKIRVMGPHDKKGDFMKVAFATKDLENINDHFGWAQQFAIYDVNKDGYEMVEVVKTKKEQPGEDVEAAKIQSKIDAIAGASIVYCEAIGPTAAAKVINNKIHPIKVSEPKTITDAANELVRMLNGNPPPWIKRIIARENGKESVES